MLKRKDGGVERAGRWAREQSRYEQLQWLKERWVRIIFVSLGVLAVCVAMLALRRDVLMGVIVGVIMTSWLWALAVLVLQETGTASTLMGAEAEAATAAQLQPMTRHGWRMFHAIPISEQNHDVDHLAICPAGVFAFETKWSGSDWFSDRQSWYLGRAIAQARERAVTFTRKRSGLELKGQQVKALLVLWGPSVDRLTSADRVRQIDDVTVVAGPWLTAWASGLTDQKTLEPAAVGRAAEAVERFLELREAHFRGPDRGRFVAGGLYGVFSDVRYGLVGAIAGAFAVIFASALLAGPSWLMFFVIAGALAIVSWIVCFKTGRNPALFGWALGATASLPLAGSWWLAAVMG